MYTSCNRTCKSHLMEKLVIRKNYDCFYSMYIRDISKNYLSLSLSLSLSIYIYIYHGRLLCIISNLQSIQFKIDLPRSGPMYYSKQRMDNQAQSLQKIPVDNVNPINGSFIATSSIQYCQKRSQHRNIRGRCVSVEYYSEQALYS